MASREDVCHRNLVGSFDSQTLQLESCAGAPGLRAHSRKAWAVPMMLRSQRASSACASGRLLWMPARRLLVLERELGIGGAIEAQPPISDAAVENSVVSWGHVGLSFDSSEATRLECVARYLLREHGKDAVIMIINRLREAFAPNITLTELQDIGGEDLIITLVQIAAENGVGHHRC